MEEVDTQAQDIKLQTRVRHGLRATQHEDEPVPIRKATLKAGGRRCPLGTKGIQQPRLEARTA